MLSLFEESNLRSDLRRLLLLPRLPRMIDFDRCSFGRCLLAGVIDDDVGGGVIIFGLLVLVVS